MSQSTIDQQIASVRAFAVSTERVAEVLRCSYADAAEFLAKLSAFVTLTQDRDFREKLNTYTKAVAQNAPELAAVKPAKVVH
jgi:hypothetical protein